MHVFLSFVFSSSMHSNRHWDSWADTDKGYSRSNRDGADRATGDRHGRSATPHETHERGRPSDPWSGCDVWNNENKDEICVKADKGKFARELSLWQIDQKHLKYV